MQLIFPANPLNPKVMDDYFKPQAEALAGMGYLLPKRLRQVFEGSRWFGGIRPQGMEPANI